MAVQRYEISLECYIKSSQYNKRFFRLCFKNKGLKWTTKTYSQLYICTNLKQGRVISKQRKTYNQTKRPPTLRIWKHTVFQFPRFLGYPMSQACFPVPWLLVPFVSLESKLEQPFQSVKIVKPQLGLFRYLCRCLNENLSNLWVHSQSHPFFKRQLRWISKGSRSVLVVKADEEMLNQISHTSQGLMSE